ncbi:RND efflux system, outer membrane lipoprotein, NodT family [Gluconacetobacter diazotrophicus PA1 5]|uniref:efflux transporter outer membrane subunit n=1 Tax=Gluconacetobacter diazotrophicus TaxID=33996 RepID=UPI000173BB63|nr:efflux transporter outer membrane subunit [Gluconacetobacter diazotrophicus]ACI50739.1 RND efflux system, outer membrane lipoprotein, NodT family [Gluconacetobacter diazotrophicus PA1 5]
MKMRRTVSVLALVAVSGCTVGPTYVPPHTDAPSQWVVQPGTPSKPVPDEIWWAGFHDPQLSRLIHEALTRNNDLAAAEKRVEAAREQIRIEAAASSPVIGLGGIAENRRQSQTIQWPPRANAGDYRYWSLGFDGSWELDLFGMTRRRTEAARASAAEMQAERDGFRLRLLAEVGADYVTWCATEARVQVAEHRVSLAIRQRDLLTHEWTAGARARADVDQAEADLAAAQQIVPPLIAQAAHMKDALAILTATAPEAMQLTPRADLSIPMPPARPPSLPSEVLTRRPDIQSATFRYARDNAEIGVAVASLYPKVAIPLDFGVTTSTLHQAFTTASLLWQLGVTAGETIYAGGRRTAQIDAARLQRDAAWLGYRQAVLNALRDVEDRLATVADTESRLSSVNVELRAAQEKRAHAQRQFHAGETALSSVLVQDSMVDRIHDQAFATRQETALASIALYKALGGGWRAVLSRDGG